MPPCRLCSKETTNIYCDARCRASFYYRNRVSNKTHPSPKKEPEWPGDREGVCRCGAPTEFQKPPPNARYFRPRRLRFCSRKCSKVNDLEKLKKARSIKDPNHIVSRGGGRAGRTSLATAEAIVSLLKEDVGARELFIKIGGGHWL